MHKQIRDLAKDFSLNENSTFIDVGGYIGNFTKHILINYNCRSIIFEPYPSYFIRCFKRFKTHPNVSVLPVGLGLDNGIMKIYPYNEGTSIFSKWHGVKEAKNKVYILDSGRLLRNFKIDAMKLNCEGAEYEIIESLDREDILKDIPQMLIAFHSMPGHTYDKTVEVLKLTHKQYIYLHKGRWEMWTKNDNTDNWNQRIRSFASSETLVKTEA